jgi:hydrocephalus-inducing protein
MKIPLVVANSTQRCTVLVRGKGNDTILDISEGLLEFNPILPYDTGSVLKITATNQSENPIEFFSLDYDKDYLEDEKIMRELPGWDDNGTLLLPPGNKLPNDIYQWYAKKQSDNSLELDTTQNLQNSRVSEVIDNPVTRALANHLGLDLSPAGRRAHNRRGISICVHGAPKSGKSSISMAISQYYGAALFSIDDIVTECLQNLESESAKKAAELCRASFAEMKEAEDAALALAQSGESAVTGDTKGTDDTTGNSKDSKDTKESKEPKGKRKDEASAKEVVAMDSSTSLVEKPYEPVKLAIDGFSSCILPENLLIQMIDDRLQLPDCQCGVVIDSLDSVFIKDHVEASQIVCRAFNNRKNMYFVNTTGSLGAYANFLSEVQLKQDKENKMKEEKDLASGEVLPVAVSAPSING